ncbi:UNVERIFIED_CONTAM: hypothetical protein Sangu_2660900 [Sesamum angustifolium]|uniref:Uncharacterized protein n=1 Tax=Sesamum angustifolium TaxID=2727405 RepID=A0AAW2J2V9_9LAMI
MRMMNSNNEGDNGSFEGDSSLPSTSGPIVPSTDSTLGDANASGPDPTPRADTLALAPGLCLE